MNELLAMNGPLSAPSFRSLPTRLSIKLDGSNEFSRRSITSTLKPNPRRGNDTSGFTIDKIKYASLGLHGRKEEVKLLNDALNRVTSSEVPDQERQLILISGYSGTGKTTLANHALKRSTEKLGGLYVRGKFDLHLRNQPYSGISAACAEICSAIVTLQNRNPSQFEQLCLQITTELGSELALLIQVIPVLANIVGFIDGNANSPPIGMTSSTDAKSKINFAFLRFIRVASQKFVPLVFVLDDLQWADGASIDLLEALLTDSTSKTKLLVVGIYRSNEVDEGHIFHHSMRDLEAKSREKYFELTRIELGNLDLEALHTIIQELLGMDDCDSSRTWGLADVCCRKTLGNVYFFLQFVSMLTERRMLQFNFGTVSWTWDEKEIDTSTKTSANVVDLLKIKMVELPDDLVALLKLASCLGSTFELHTLSLVWDGSKNLTTNNREKSNTLMENLASLVEEGYLVVRESSSNSHESYSWSHDKVQEAALALVPEADQGSFAAKVGQILLSRLDEKALDSALFVVVNLLNGFVDGQVDGGQVEGCQVSQLDLARLNYRASQKAILCSAFDSAAGYVAIGSRMLPENAWIDHYELALNIHTAGAKAEGVLGNTDIMEQYCKQVISQADRPIEDKFGVYNTWIDSVMNRVQLEEARDMSLEILKKFNCQFPTSSALVGWGVIRNVIKIKATMKSRDVSKLRMCSDATRIELLRIMDRLVTIFYMLEDDRMPILVFKALNWTMKYGYCEYSSVAFALTGLILAGALNDLQGGYKYGEQALVLLERSKSQFTAARTMFIVDAFVFPWTRPLRSLLKSTLRGYDIGLQTG
jgi:predicted ATPase